MQTSKIIYRLADCASDYTACHKILKLHGRPSDWKLHFPTVIAVKDKKVLGFLSTVKCSWSVLAGPLETLEPQVNGIMILRLLEAYDVVLRTMGVTRYCFEVKKENDHWIKQINRGGGAICFSSNDTTWYFERFLKELPQRLAA